MNSITSRSAAALLPIVAQLVFGAPIGGIVVASGRERGQSKRLVTRLYYDSLGAIQLVKKRSLYIVTIRDKDRALLQRIYIRNQDRAFEFVDAIESLKTK